jgi:uncharacterized oligopeptide transporter (OPT) family protein
MLAATAYIAIFAYVLFDIPIWMGILAVVLNFFLAIVSCRATGETDIPPVGPLGKISQLMYAGIDPGNYTTNLVASSVTAGAATHSSDLLVDLKTGYLLGGSPRKQFIAQFLGIVFGAGFCIPAYMLLVRPEEIASTRWPAPAAMQWAAVADLLANGVSYEERGAGEAVMEHVSTVYVSQRLPGMAPGDEIRVATGPNAGRHRITMVDRSALVLDGPVKAGAEGDLHEAEIVAPSGESRGKTNLTPSVLDRPALRFTSRPAGARAGDYVLAVVNGQKIYHRMIGLDGDVAMLDHAFVPGQAPVPVTVKKMGLPPYALEATLVAVLIGVIITLLDAFGPRRWRPYLPSVMGLGIAFIVGFGDSLGLAAGAVIGWVIARIWPRLADRYTVSTSSGVIAGASIMSLIIIGLSIAGLVHSPE